MSDAHKGGSPELSPAEAELRVGGDGGGVPHRLLRSVERLVAIGVPGGAGGRRGGSDGGSGNDGGGARYHSALSFFAILLALLIEQVRPAIAAHLEMAKQIASNTPLPEKAKGPKK